MHSRENNLDLLRIISCISVIMIHVSSTWFTGSITRIQNGLSMQELNRPYVACFYNSISRFAVPCFVMISGAFILKNSKIKNYIHFYSHSFKKIGVPTIIFSLLYLIYNLFFCFVGGEKDNPLDVLYNFISGAPMYHMWYLYMILGVYALAPIVVMFKESINEKQFRIISIVFLILASLSRWTTRNIGMNWDIGQAFEYLGYFMIGNCIHESLGLWGGKKNNLRAMLMIAMGVLFELFASYLEYLQINAGIISGDLEYQIVEPYSPLIVCGSIFIFSGFCITNINKSMWRLSADTLYIYLFHGGVWNIIEKISWHIKGEDFFYSLNPIVSIPLFVFIVFMISFFLSEIYKKFEQSILVV